MRSTPIRVRLGRPSAANTWLGLPLWQAEPELLRKVCSHPFRHKEDVSQYVIREWQKLSGDFVNKNSRFEVAYQEGDALIKGLKMVLVDKETGVNYLFCSRDMQAD